MVGPLIRAARKAPGWTQGELAHRAGISRWTLSEIERGVAPEHGELDPLACDADALLSLIDRGYLTFHDAWLTITAAGKVALALEDETELAQDG